MTSRRIVIFAACIVAAVAITATIAYRLPSLCLASTVRDKQIASALAERIQSAHIDRDPKSARFKIGVYPGCAGNATLKIYEVTDRSAMLEIEAYGRLAQSAVPGAGTVSLRFYEREVWEAVPGGQSRGNERLLHRVTLRRSSSPN